MKQLLSSLETEYGFAAWDPRRNRISYGRIAKIFAKTLEATLPWLPASEGGWFLGNGARLYWDCGEHPEYATPECAGHPRQLIAHIRAGHDIVARVVAKLQEQRRIGHIRVWRGNVDYLTGASWGSHENYLTQRATETLAPDLIPHLVSRVIYGGAGGFSPHDHSRFSLSPRLELFNAVMTSDTMRARGIINTRAEHHAPNHRRLHLICRDSVASQTADLLSIGITRLVVALADMGLGPGDRVALRNPLSALHAFCADPTCEQQVRTARGRLCAIDIQRHYLGVINTHLDELPDWAGELVALGDKVLNALGENPQDLCGVLDWPTKLMIFNSGPKRSTQELLLEDTLLSELNSPLDQYYSRAEQEVDSVGACGMSAMVVGDDDIETACRNAPDLTRARIRGEVIKRLSGKREALCYWGGIFTPEQTLNLDEPFESRERWRASASEEGRKDRGAPDVLDIPAFLRRQHPPHP